MPYKKTFLFKKTVSQLLLFFLASSFLSSSFPQLNPRDSFPNPSPSLLTAAQTLADAARQLPDSLQLSILRPALALTILEQYSRILPDDPPLTDILYLINLLLSHSPEPHLLQNYLSKLPPADSIIFNGHQLLGAALARPDNLIGLDSLPIALSRRIPALLFPLRNDQAPLLTQFVQTSSFSLSTLRTRTQNFYQAPIADLLFADGLFLRPYSGKIDDLYVHFVQKNHTLLSILSFYAIAESLPARRYSPITGIGSPLSVPTPWFNVNDILSGGALLAVEQYRSSHQTPSSIPNPFSNFAIRILPYLDSSINSLQPGSTLTISRELIRQAIRHPKRFSPKPVPPILNDPSRFFGSYSPIFQLASRRLSRKELATAIRQIDFETPLPDIPATPSANELLAEPTSWAPAFSEDEIPLLPQEENSLSEELAFTPPPQNPSPPPTKRVEPIYPEPILPKTPTQQPNQSKPQKNIPSPLPSEPPLVATLPTFSIQNQIITSNSVGQHFLPQTQNSSTTQSLAAPFSLPNPISQETTSNSTNPSPPPPSTLLAQIPSPQSKIPELLHSDNPTAEEIPQPPPIPNPQLTLPSPSPHRLTPTQSPTPTPNLPLSLPQEKASPSELPAPSSLLASLLSPTEPHSSPIHLSFYATNTLLPPQPYQTSLDLVTAKTSIPLASPTRLEPPSSLLQPSIHPIPAQIPKPDFTINSLPPQPSPLTNLYSSLTTSNFSESPITFSLLHPILLPQTSIPKLPQLEQILPTLAASAPTPTPPQPKPTKSEPIQLPDFSSAPYVAIVTPTIEACESYTTALAANDQALSTLLSQLNRTQLYLRWLDAATTPLEEFLAQNPNLPESVIAQIHLAINLSTDEMARLLQLRTELLRQRQTLLAQRQALQIELNSNLQKNLHFLQKNALGSSTGA